MMRMGRAVLLLLLLMSAVMSMSRSALAAGERPNIVMILADDLGYGDVGCFGAADIRTPHLDRLAAEGVRLTDCYAAESVCSPTRAALMTGRYPQRIGLEWAVWYNVPGEGLPGAEKALPRMLREVGYATAMSGKWHLGYDADMTPTAHGFERFFGSLGGNIDYFRHVDRDGKRDLYLGEDVLEANGYATDLTAEYAVRFIEESAGRPFFLYVPFNAPHFPFQGPGDEAKDLRGKRYQEGDRATYAAMVERMDAGIGRILAALDARHLTRSTLVIFTSDNGGYLPLSSNAPLQRGKGTEWEGGVRVPGIMRWPGRIPAGKVSGQPVITMDLTATIAAAAGASAPADRPFDGVDVMPLLTGEAAAMERRFFWRRAADPYRANVEPHRAMREGNWKYIDDAQGGRWLFDLSRDVGESRNLLDQHAELADRLRGLLDAWEAEIDPPLYDQRSAAVKRKQAMKKGAGR